MATAAGRLSCRSPRAYHSARPERTRRPGPGRIGGGTMRLSVEYHGGPLEFDADDGPARRRLGRPARPPTGDAAGAGPRGARASDRLSRRSARSSSRATASSSRSTGPCPTADGRPRRDGRGPRARSGSSRSPRSSTAAARDGRDLATAARGRRWSSTTRPTASRSPTWPATEAGRRIYLNRLLADADCVIPIGRLGYDAGGGFLGPWSVIEPGLGDAARPAGRSCSRPAATARAAARRVVRGLLAARAASSRSRASRAGPACSQVARRASRSRPRPRRRRCSTRPGASRSTTVPTWSSPASAGPAVGRRPRSSSRRSAQAFRLVRRGGKVALLVAGSTSRRSARPSAAPACPGATGRRPSPGPTSTSPSAADADEVDDLGLIPLDRPEQAVKLADVGPLPHHDQPGRPDPRGRPRRSRTGSATHDERLDIEPGYFAAATRSVGSTDRSDRVRIEVAGPDRAKVLHNLTTNDIKRLAPGAGPRGVPHQRPGEDARLPPVHADDDRLLVRSDPGTAEAILAHLAQVRPLRRRDLRRRLRPTRSSGTSSAPRPTTWPDRSGLPVPATDLGIDAGVVAGRAGPARPREPDRPARR